MDKEEGIANHRYTPFATTVRLYTDKLWVAYSARHLGVSVRTLQYWRSGKHQPSKLAQEGIYAKLREEHRRVFLSGEPRYKYPKKNEKKTWPFN